MAEQLSDGQTRSWAADGYLHVPGVLPSDELEQLRSCVDRVSARADGDSGILQHYEVVGDDEIRICRSERLIEGDRFLRLLLTAGSLPAMAGALLGEPAVLYKEKINHKPAGGAGFSPHQDAPAYPFVDTHLTCMLAIDDATLDNGCLEVAAGHHLELLDMDDSGCIRADIADGLPWSPLPMAAGDLLWFHSLAPHRSGPNASRLSRRALFGTYNAAASGDLREAYYREKSRRFAAGDQRETTRVSLIGDFQGRAPRPDQLAQLRRRSPEQGVLRAGGTT